MKTRLDHTEQIRLDRANIEACLALADQRLVDEESGYFGPNSVVWTIFREPCVLIGGYRAIMMQVAHPAVAQGIEQSSSFRNDVIGRAKRTIQAMNSLIFGSKESAQTASRMMHAVHHQVKGWVPENSDSSWAGRPFRANDPVLTNWVGLTTIDSALALFECLVRPLQSAEREQLAGELQTLALLCGLPETYLHDTLDELKDEINTLLNGDEMAVGDIGRGIVNDLFSFTPGSLDQRITYGLLPPKIKALYQITWDESDQADHQKLVQRLSFLNRSLPKGIRYVPAYNHAVSRIEHLQEPAKAEDEGQPRRKEQPGRFYLRLFGMDEADPPAN